MQKHVNLVDLFKSFPTNIFLQNLASIQRRTSPVKFAHLAEKSGKGSISNLSTKVHRGLGANRLARLEVRLAKREAASASSFALVDTAPLRSAFRDLREAHLHDFRAELEVYGKRRLMAQGYIRGIRQEAIEQNQLIRMVDDDSDA